MIEPVDPSAQYEASKEHQRDKDFADALAKSAYELSAIVIRTAIIVSGGSVVVGLAFVSSIFVDRPVLAGQFLLSVLIFGIGVLLSALGGICSYYAQLRYSESAFSKSHHLDRPYVRQTPRSEQIWQQGVRWHKWAAGLIVSSYISIIAGIIWVYLTLVSPPSACIDLGLFCLDWPMVVSPSD